MHSVEASTCAGLVRALSYTGERPHRAGEAALMLYADTTPDGQSHARDFAALSGLRGAAPENGVPSLRTAASSSKPAQLAIPRRFVIR